MWSEFVSNHILVSMMFWGVTHWRIQSHWAPCWQYILKLFSKHRRLYCTWKFGGKLRLFQSSKRKVKVAQSFPTLCDSMDYTVHRILQAKILEWVAFPFSRLSSRPRNQNYVSHIAGGFFTSWATGKPKNTGVGSLSLLQQIFPTQESNWGLLPCRWILYQLSYQGSTSKSRKHSILKETNIWIDKTFLSYGYRLSPGTLQLLKISQQRNSQPRRAEKKPSVRQNIKQEKLRKKKISEVASGSVCQMLLRHQRAWTEITWSLELAPRHPGRNPVGAVFSWVRTAVKFRRDEKRKGGEDVEWVNIDISSQECCYKRESKML